MIAKMIELGIDPSTALPTEQDIEDRKNEPDYVDPLQRRLEEISDEHVLAFRLAKAGLDSVYRIGNNWTYNMVREAVDFLEIEQKYQERADRREESQAN